MRHILVYSFGERVNSLTHLYWSYLFAGSSWR